MNEKSILAELALANAIDDAVIENTPVRERRPPPCHPASVPASTVQAGGWHHLKDI
jgi:hypothetical protein